MPELPEVEITRRGIEPWFAGRRASAVVIRNAALRYPVPADLPARLAGARLAGVRRRGKYLLFGFDTGTLIVHLGMSGSLRRVSADAPVRRHDHVDIVFGAEAMRYHDPRRFGAMVWAGAAAEAHPLIAGLGLEPLGADFTGAWLHDLTRRRTTPIKQLLMDARLIVGVGNIYASESLFRAGIRPTARAGGLSRRRCERLAQAVRDVLEAAIDAGGSSLRDFVHADGAPGEFQTRYFVYGRAGEPCRVCAGPIRQSRMGQRSTFHCPRCQR